MNPETELPIRSGGFAHESVTLAAAPPLIEGESPAGYDELLARVRETLQPGDVLEQIWIREIVDLVWETFRLRRIKANLMSAAAYEGMAEVLRPLVDCPDRLAQSWARRGEKALRTIEAALAKAGSGRDAVAARTFSVRIGDFERIERMLAGVEARRNAVLRELDRYRASFARRLRRTVEAFDDADLEIVRRGEPGAGSEAA
jgi:hypothetical protein